MEKTPIQYVEQYSKAITTALGGVIDNANFLKENIENYPSSNDKVQVETYVNELALTAERYESLRKKLIKGDFNLSPLEIADCGVALLYARESMYADKATLDRGIEIATKAATGIFGGDVDKINELTENFRKF